MSRIWSHLVPELFSYFIWSSLFLSSISAYTSTSLSPAFPFLSFGCNQNLPSIIVSLQVLIASKHLTHGCQKNRKATRYPETKPRSPKIVKSFADKLYFALCTVQSTRYKRYRTECFAYIKLKNILRICFAQLHVLLNLRPLGGNVAQNNI